MIIVGFFNNYTLETVPMSFNEEMVKCSAVGPYCQIQLHNKRGHTIEHIALLVDYKSKKKIAKDHTKYDFFNITL